MLREVGEVEPVVASGVDEDLIGLPAGVQVEAGYLAAAPRCDLGDDAGEHGRGWRCLFPTSGDNKTDQQTDGHNPPTHGGKRTPAQTHRRAGRHPVAEPTATRPPG
jgi:hypothetical protein